MALVVEDGTGLASAQSLGSLSQAATYFVTFGYPDGWTTLTDAQKEAKLWISALVMAELFNWNGTILTAGQALCFPRYGLYDESGTLLEGVPERAQRAQFEITRIGGDYLTVPQRAGSVTAQSLGPISRSYAGSVAGFVGSALLGAHVAGLVFGKRFGAVQAVRMTR